jgi:eukaryotic-like serine/threonine-protein kinase
MSEVYRARDTVIGRTVAIKILTEAGCADPDAKARFLQEARLAGNIEHDNVISIYDFGKTTGSAPTW